MPTDRLFQTQNFVPWVRFRFHQTYRKVGTESRESYQRKAGLPSVTIVMATKGSPVFLLVRISNQSRCDCLVEKL